MEIFKNKVFTTLEKQPDDKRIKDWRDEILSRADILNEAINVESAIRIILEGIYEKYLTVLFY